MANLVQSDWEALAPQLLNKKRTSGANSGKVIVSHEESRGLFQGSPPVSGALAVRLIFADGAQEVLVFNPEVECYAPGMADTLAHLHQ